MAALATAGRPLVVSLHGSDVFVAERHAVAGSVARRTFARAGWVTACSADLRDRAVGLGADADRSSVIPYGVDADSFPRGDEARARGRALLGVAPDVPLVVTVGRFVKKKGFEYLIDAVPALVARHPTLQVAIAGHGDLEAALRARARQAGVGDHVRFPGLLAHQSVPLALAAADVVVVPPLVATAAGGIGAVLTDGDNGLLVAERDAAGLATAIDRLLADRELGARLGSRARSRVQADHGWSGVAAAFEAAYDAARGRAT
jgi:glycosyltransferase involved in cell wall biosynthesis